MLKFNKDFNVKIISLLVAVLFLFNSAVYGIDLPRNTPTNKLRPPMATQNNPERLKVAKLISDLENIIAYLKAQVEDGKIIDKEQEAQDMYSALGVELLSKHAEVFNGRPTHEIEYLSYVIKEWLERLRQYPNKSSMIYGQTRQEAYASYAELVLVELKASIAIAKGQYAKSLQDVEYKGKSHFVTVYKLDELPSGKQQENRGVL